MAENLSSDYHSMKRRCKAHDYYLPGTYLLTLVCRGRRPLFGRLINKVRPYVAFSPLGEQICMGEIPKITYFYPQVQIWQKCVMPDHLHLIVRVSAQLPENTHLGKIMIGFKSGCNNAFWNIVGKSQEGLFEPGYNDRILYHPKQLKAWKQYLRDNPTRLWIKRQNPDLFRTQYTATIHGCQCCIFGNQFLLDIPQKEAVIVHSHWSPDTFNDAKKHWLKCAERGAVLVSAAISQREKEVINEAIDMGLPVIKLKNHGFWPLYKPSGKDFYACAAGDLLEISPWPYNQKTNGISRQECCALNTLALKIASSHL